ncbi:carbohydrate sulfotransferase 1-like isoform X1 [Stylophora pistillata]|uniref:carbohydrate sulfotransferase 1-like isoform X1 n=1 Tax=Stylophora pistillata TaxID=50429 RepID=UPI000C042951|nr:carbohydrate sulfotransferase 1-like isoform X1 [Stylophora pistillata]
MRLKMRTRNFLKYWLALLGVSQVVLGYVFYTLHVKTYRGKQSIVKNEQGTYIQIPSPRAARKSLIVFGQDRSGTTFVSAMFANDSQIFMVYEPLWITQRWFFHENQYYHRCINCELQVVSSLVACNFTRSPVSTKFLSYVSTPWTGALPVNIFNTPNFCNKTGEVRNVDCSELGKDPEFVDHVCSTKYKHSVVKVAPTRLPKKKLADLIPRVLLENPDIDVRVLHLVRDPRGNINSRINLNWVKDYPNPKLPSIAADLCGLILINLYHAHNTLTDLGLKHKYKLILYKQISDDPLGTAKEIYDFAGFDMPLETKKWILETTKPSEEKLKKELEKPYSIVRNASGNADKWRQDAFYFRNRIIERHCKTLLDSLGLERVSRPNLANHE